MTTSVGGQYAWVGAFGAAWNVAANWTDLIATASAIVAPGALDRVSIVGGATPFAITGSGEAASIATYRSVLLSGQFAATTLDAEGALTVAGAGSVLTLGALGQAGAAVTSSVVVSGARLTVVGSADLGTMSVVSGGRARLGGLAAVSGGIAVDSRSCAEIGGDHGSFWAGWLKIYADGTLSGSGAITTSAAISGTVLSSGMRFERLVVGQGQIRMDAAGATVAQVAAGMRLVFAAHGAVLTLTDPARMAGSLVGFGAGDAIDIGTPVTTASFAAQSAGGGILTLSGAGGVVASLSLVGDSAAYAASRFLLLPDGRGGTLVLDVPPSAAGAAGPGNATPHHVVWAGESGASWSRAANWSDQTSPGAAAATTAPGSLDSVSIVGGSLPVVITGAGAAASIAIFQSVLLDGVVTAATVDVEGVLMVAGPGSVLTLGALGQAGAAVASSILVNGASLSVAGSASLGALGVVAGRVRLGGLALSGGMTLDAASCVEVGGVGGFWPGWLKIYAGGVVSGSGVIAASTLLRGVVLSSGLRFDGLLSGSGEVRIDASGATVAQVYADSRLVFVQSGAVLTLSAPSAMAGTLVGFSAGDAIDVAASVTTASYRAVSPGMGVLQLSGAGGPIAALTVAGDAATFAASRFLLLPDGQGGTLVLDIPPAVVVAPGAGNASPHRVAWAGLSGASWLAASSWRDFTAQPGGAAAIVAPGSLDSVSIVGSGRPVVVTGSGAAAAIATFRSVLLDGSFAAGTLDVEGVLTVAGAGSAVIVGALGQAGAAVASNIVVNGASLLVQGAASLGSLGVVSGGRARLGTVARVSGGIAVDRFSCAEIGGDHGSFWGGWLKIYADGTLSGSGVVATSAVISGTVFSSGMRFDGLVIGAGQIRMDAAGATVGQVAAGMRLVFAAPGAVLTVNAPLSMAGTLVGFDAGDGIELPGLAAATAEYAGIDASHGRLSVFDARHELLAAFTMVGDSGAYQAAAFSVLPDGGGGVFIAETAAAIGASGSLTHPS